MLTTTADASVKKGISYPAKVPIFRIVQDFKENQMTNEIKPHIMDGEPMCPWGDEGPLSASRECEHRSPSNPCIPGLRQQRDALKAEVERLGEGYDRLENLVYDENDYAELCENLKAVKAANDMLKAHVKELETILNAKTEHYRQQESE